MSLRLTAVSFDAHDPGVVGAFWAGMLGREIVEEARGVLVPGDGTQVGLRFVGATTERSGRNRLHLHLTSSTLEDQRHTVEAALGLGGRHLDVGQRPDEGHVVLADPGGNEFCVIEPGDDYLAGCGPLAEVSCDGSRRAGLFWRDALGWPLVWDRGDEVVIQSPAGGTKIAWDTWADAPKEGRNRQRFDLAAPDPAAEAARLVALGATELGARAGRVLLADPDGSEFSVDPG